MWHNMRWTLEKIKQRLQLIEPLVYRESRDLPGFRLHLVPDTQPEEFLAGAEVDDRDWPVLEPYTYWGEWRSHFTLRTEFQCPENWSGKSPVALFLPLGDPGDFGHPEALVYLDREPYAACDRYHQEIELPEAYLDQKAHGLTLQGWTGMGNWLETRPRTKLFLRPCCLVRIDQELRDFIATARVAWGTAAHLVEDHPSRGFLLNALDEAFRLLDLREPIGDGFYASIAPAHQVLREGIQKAGPASDVRVWAAGNAHLDLAWLWPLSQTRGKARRTFRTVLRLMEQFPDYYFTQSQPQLYDFLRQDDPELFVEIRNQVDWGRWELIGGMWVEADCNLSGPESLARQLLLGRRFFREHFGPEAESPVLWLPDVFGYAANLPQLIQSAGMHYFFTIKIGWNQYNRLPYDTFWWQGLDGTKVLTHFSTTPSFSSYSLSTYTARATPEENLGTWNLFQQKEQVQDLLMAYGHGDGGGGPTREMLENIREMADFPAVPRLRPGRVGDFFQHLEKTIDERLPTWNGELYLELHRGTYTTQGRNKRANRQSEFLLHDAEFLSCLASLLRDPAYVYPGRVLSQAWKLVCLNQFHDIIPGSSIGRVYVESSAQYEEIRQMGEEVKQQALESIHRYTGGHLLVVNATSFEQAGPVFWTHDPSNVRRVVSVKGQELSMQRNEQGAWIDVGILPPFSVTPLSLTPGPAPEPSKPIQPVAGDALVLENECLRVEFNRSGDIIRILDKTYNREVLPPGALGNQFMAFEDRPLKWEAWDIDIFYDDKHWLSEPAASITRLENGPLCFSLEIKRRILNSDYRQRIYLRRNSPLLCFETMIDWRERNTLLKVAFPVLVFSLTATYEIQWGNVERPTHRNTSWDWARFETCAQKWVDLSEGDYGVSLINDGKYGHDIQGHTMRLSLLRSSKHPDPEADQGEHRFTYAILPHEGRWDRKTLSAAYGLNDPPLVWERKNAVEPTGRIPEPLIRIDRLHVVIETIKKAEEDGSFIVRMYETQRRRGEVRLIAGFRIKKAELVNLLEEKQAELATDGNCIRFFIKPYQIITLRLFPEGFRN